MSRTNVLKLFLIWILLVTFIYWFLGPFSYIGFYDEADLTASRLLFEAKHYLGGLFLHAFQGGADYYASFERGGEYVNFERLLYGYLPLWIAHWIHKILLLVVCMSGIYLLVRHVTQVDRFYAFCVAAFASLFNPYALNNTIQHGIGYAVLPLAVYVYVFLIGKKQYLLYTNLLSVFIAISSSPTKSFFVVFTSVLVFALFFLRSHYPKFFLALFILLVLEIANASEIFYGFLTYGLDSARAVYGGIRPEGWQILLNGWNYLLGKTDYFIFGHIIYPAVSLSVLIFALAFYMRVREAGKMLLLVLIFCQLPAFLYLVPWEKIGLTFLYSVNIYRLSFCMIIPVCLLGGYMMKQCKNNNARYLAILFLGMAIFMQCMQMKIVARGMLLGFNQSKLMTIPNLVKRDWEPKNLFRVVTAFPYYGIHPNFMWSYGLETMDGYLNLVPAPLLEFWHYGIHKSPFSKNNAESFIAGNAYITYAAEENPHGKRIDLDVLKEVNIDDFIDVNLLRLANVSHIISYVPLRGEGLVKVSGPNDQHYLHQWLKEISKIEKIKMGFNHLFNPPEVFVYKIGEESDRAFFPVSLHYLNADQNITEKYRSIAKHYQKNIGFSEKKDLKLGQGLIQSIVRVRDGYDVDVSVADRGVFILNTFPLKFWKVYVDGVSMESFPVNIIHIGVNVETGRHKIIFRYERPLMRNKLLTLLHGISSFK